MTPKPSIDRTSTGVRLCIAVLAVLPAFVLAGEPASDLAGLAGRLAREHAVCAVAFATIAGGVVNTAGSASGCDSAPSLNEDSVFQAASLSKPVFAYTVLKLVEQGLLDLDAPLVKYLPGGYLHRRNPFDFDGEPVVALVADPRLGEVSARMVLSHTSGLPNWSRGPLTFSFTPGSSWQYSGEGYMLLQRVVEAVTGEALDRLAKRLVFVPLGMVSTEFRWSDEFAERVVAGRTANGQTRHARFRAAMAPASLYTTAKDYARFMAALLDEQPTLELTVRQPVHVSRWLGLDWGLGWGIEQADSERYLWQWGNNPGYRAFAMAATTSRHGVVVLTNSDTGLEVALPLVQAALPGPHAAFRFRMLR